MKPSMRVLKTHLVESSTGRGGVKFAALTGGISMKYWTKENTNRFFMGDFMIVDGFPQFSSFFEFKYFRFQNLIAGKLFGSLVFSVRI